MIVLYSVEGQASFYDDRYKVETIHYVSELYIKNEVNP